MTTNLDAAKKRPTLEQILKAAPMLARATRALEPLLLAQGPEASTSSVIVHSPTLTEGQRVPLTAELRDALLRAIDAGTLGYCELDVPMLAYEQRTGVDNRNFVCFRDASMRAIGKTGEGKPFLRDHAQRDSMARGGTLIESGAEVPTEGHYELRQVARLTEPWAIAMYLRGNMTTVSIGWIPTGPVLCSVCNAPVGEKCGGWWKHWPGDRLKEITDDDGNKIYVDSSKGSIVVRWIYTAAELIETSCVPVPGVPTAEMDPLGLRATLAAQFAIDDPTGFSDEESPLFELTYQRVRGKSPPAEAALSVDPQPETSMADQNDAPKFASLRKALAAALILPEAHRAHAATLSAEDAETFCGKSAAEREADVKAALDADPVVFAGDVTGIKVRRSASPETLQYARLAEEGAASNRRHEAALAADRAEREVAEVASICKAKLSSLPGSDDVHRHIVGTLRKAGGPLLDASLTALAAASTNIAKQSRAPGVGGEQDSEEPKDALAAWLAKVDIFMAAEQAKGTKVVDRNHATELFLATLEGRAAKQTYDESRGYGQRPTR